MARIKPVPGWIRFIMPSTGSVGAMKFETDSWAASWKRGSIWVWMMRPAWFSVLYLDALESPRLGVCFTSTCST